MNQETIALVFMADSNDSFFIENPPKGNPEDWISAFANKSDVEYVEVVERGSRLKSWSNSNVCPERDF